MLKGLAKAQALKEFRSLRMALTDGSLKSLDKARGLKRFRELRVLLGGDGVATAAIDPLVAQKDLRANVRALEAKVEAAKDRETALKIAVAAAKKDPDMQRYAVTALRDYVLTQNRENYVIDFPKPVAKKYLSSLDVSREFHRLRKVTDTTPFRIVGKGNNGSIEISVYDSKDRKDYDFFINRPYQEDDGDFTPMFGKSSWIADALSQWFSGQPVSRLVSPTKDPKWDRLNIESTFLEALKGGQDDAVNAGSGGGDVENAHVKSFELDGFVHNVVLELKLKQGESLFSQRILTRKTKITKDDAETYGLPRSVDAWRVSIIQAENGRFYSKIEPMTTSSGSAGAVSAYFGELESYAEDVIGRIAPSVAKAARDDWEKANNSKDQLLLTPSTEPAINPLYQSVLDGAPVTRELILQVKAEGEKDLSHPQLRPVVQVLWQKCSEAA
jgi:hypothetical protein